MTKKTNSLILRYGISTLWKKKTSSVSVLSNMLQLGDLINVWLKKKNLNLVFTKYGAGFIFVFVYKFFFLDEKFKNNIVKCYKKTLDEKNIIQKFGIKKNQLRYILSSSNQIKKNSNFNNISKNNLFYFLWVLQYKRYLSFLLWMTIKSFSIAGLNSSNFLLKKLNFFFTAINFLNRTKINFGLRRGISLRKINGFLKSKLIAKGLENLIYKLKYQKIAVKLKNIYLTKGFSRVPFFGKQVIKSEFRFKFITIFLAIAYTNSFLISEYVAGFLKKGKQHRKTLQFFTGFFERIFFSGLVSLSGFQLRVTGKLGGKLRKSKYHYKIGKVQLQTFKNLLSYCFTTTYTKFGVISVKVWLVQQNEHNLV